MGQIDDCGGVERNKMNTSKTYRCTDGLVVKEIQAATAAEAAETYAIVTTDVSVVEIDGEGNPVSRLERIKVLID
jgi:ligand-binding sensor protein